MIRKIQRVQKVLNEAALHTQRFQKASQLTCPSGCSLCCLKKDISASTLEFLPLAYHLYKTHQADAFYDRVEQTEEQSICSLFSPIGINGGGCSEYEYRGLICRLFGYAATHDKQGQNRMVTCKTLKATEAFQLMKPAILKLAPIFPDYYMKLAAIDWQLANEQLPINQAIKRALELVLTYFQYRNRKRSA